jgi:hypothetical protein
MPHPERLAIHLKMAKLGDPVKGQGYSVIGQELLEHISQPIIEAKNSGDDVG